MRDKKAKKRRRLMREEIQRDCQKYDTECVSLGKHKITKNEEQMFLNMIHKNNINK